MSTGVSSAPVAGPMVLAALLSEAQGAGVDSDALHDRVSALDAAGLLLPVPSPAPAARKGTTPKSSAGKRASSGGRTRTSVAEGWGGEVASPASAKSALLGAYTRALEAAMKSSCEDGGGPDLMPPAREFLGELGPLLPTGVRQGIERLRSVAVGRNTDRQPEADASAATPSAVVASTESARLMMTGLVAALGISLHNLPEGLIVRWHTVAVCHACPMQCCLPLQ